MKPSPSEILLTQFDPQEFSQWVIAQLQDRFALSEALIKPVTWLLRRPGKGLRPRLALATAAACGQGRSEGLLAVAVAGELLHSASLLHDDLVDASSTRRGATTLHREFDPLTAVLAGDYLLGAAYAWLSQDAGNDALRRLGPAVLALAEAELTEIHHRHSAPDVAFSEKVALGKTGSLFGWIAAASAAESDHNDELDAWNRWGEALGLLFQLADDLGDHFGQFADKPVHLDAATGTPSLLRALLSEDPTGTSVSAYLERQLLVLHNPPQASAPLLDIIQRIRTLVDRAAQPLRPSLRAAG